MEGVHNCPAAHVKELKRANELVARTCTILKAAFDAGTEFAIENPADRGDPLRTDLFMEADHAPLWLMPDIISLSKHAVCKFATFPFCAFGVDYPKQTTLMYSRGLSRGLQDLDLLRCEHGNKHNDRAGGEKSNGVWNSAAAGAYPPDLNLWLAQAYGQLKATHREIPEHPVVARFKDKALGHTHEASAAPTRQFATDSNPASRLDGTNVSNTASLKPIKDEIVENTPKPLQPIIEELPHPFPTPSPARVPVKLEKDNSNKWWYTDTKDVISSRTRSSKRKDGENVGSTFMMARLDGFDSTCEAPSALVVQSPVTSSTSQMDPKNHYEAMRDDAEGWSEAELAELKNHQDNQSFTLMDRSKFESEAPGRRLVKLVWVYKRKRSGRMKARLCVQGCTQQPGIDFDQTHCATMRGTSLRLLSSLAGQHGLMMRRWDFVSAFLQGDLEQGEVIYCSPPPGPHGTLGKDNRQRVWRVNKPVYGMAQAGRRWQRTLFPWLKEWGLKACDADSCVFVLRKEVQTNKGPRMDTLIVGCYVDDLFILYNSDDEFSLYSSFTKDLQARWSVDDEGDVSDLLNVEIHRVDGGVELRQTSYIEKLVSEWFPDGAPTWIHANTTPHSMDIATLVADSLACVDPVDTELLRRYQSLVGSLLYAATNTRPDIAYAVGMLCRAMGKPSKELFEAAERVLGYLYRHKEVGLRYECDQRPLSGMSDADWAVKHSTSGFVFTMSKAAISWGSKKQPSIALSSCESEIMAASEAAKEAIYLDRFVDELGYKLSDEPIHLSLDNKAAIDSSYNPENHARTKHIDRRHYFIRELVEEGRLVVPFVSTVDNHADFFTKPLRPCRFFELRNKIMNCS